MVCGYVITSGDPRDMRPWAAYVNSSGVVTSTRIFADTGLFTRVKELPNGKFVFCGFRGDGTNFNLNFRNANLKVISSTLVQLNSISLGSGNTGVSFDIFHDIEVIDMIA